MGEVTIPTVLGILGIVFAWLFALVGHALSIIGIITGIKEYKNENKKNNKYLDHAQHLI